MYNEYWSVYLEYITVATIKVDILFSLKTLLPVEKNMEHIETVYKYIVWIINSTKTHQLCRKSDLYCILHRQQLQLTSQLPAWVHTNTRASKRLWSGTNHNMAVVSKFSHAAVSWQRWAKSSEVFSSGSQLCREKNVKGDITGASGYKGEGLRCFLARKAARQPSVEQKLI